MKYTTDELKSFPRGTILVEKSQPGGRLPRTFMRVQDGSDLFPRACEYVSLDSGFFYWAGSLDMLEFEN